jgi:hypothetical protein
MAVPEAGIDSYCHYQDYADDISLSTMTVFGSDTPELILVDSYEESGEPTARSLPLPRRRLYPSSHQNLMLKRRASS